jgi:hypothetical protein
MERLGLHNKEDTPMDKINPFLTATATAAFASTRLHTLGLQPRPSRPVFESRERAIYSAYCAITTVYPGASADTGRDPGDALY